MFSDEIQEQVYVLSIDNVLWDSLFLKGSVADFEFAYQSRCCDQLIRKQDPKLYLLAIEYQRLDLLQVYLKLDHATLLSQRNKKIIEERLALVLDEEFKEQYIKMLY